MVMTGLRVDIAVLPPLEAMASKRTTTVEPTVKNFGAALTQHGSFIMDFAIPGKAKRTCKSTLGTIPGKDGSPASHVEGNVTTILTLVGILTAELANVLNYSNHSYEVDYL